MGLGLLTETETWQRIARYALGECTAEEAVATAAWIEADPERKALAEQLIRIADAGPTPIFDAARAWQQLRPTVTKTREAAPPPVQPLRVTPFQQPRRGGRQWLLAASIVLAMLGTSVVTFQLLHTRPSPDVVALEQLRTITTQQRQTAEVYLNDGTRVRLGPASTIRFAERFGKTRDVWLEGVAYFEVAKEERGWLRRERPFAVRTSQGVVRDIGTSFAVRAYEGSTITEVVVAEGAVALAPAARDVPARAVADSLLLSAGDLGRLDASGSLAIERGVDVAAYLAWMQGRLVFADAPIADVITQFRHWYGLDIQLGERALADARVTATFDLRSPNNAVDLLTAVLDVRTVRSGNTLILRRNRR